MENTFDNDLKQRLDEASLPEAGLRFDKDRLWDKIEKKKAKKRIAFSPWISHAAAVAAGLAVGIFLFVPKNQQVSDHKVIVQQKEVPVLQTITDTVYIAKNEQQRHPRPAPVTISKTQQQIPITTEPQNLPGVTDNPHPAKEEQPVLVMKERVPAKVLHLSDMDNENAQPHIRAQEKPLFFVAFPDRDQSGSGTETETFSLLIAQKLNLKKN